jgi:transketolase
MANDADLRAALPGQYGEQDQQAVNTIRVLAMDAVQTANSGHPGTAMALAPLTHVLFSRVMNFDPSNPNWPDRDRFVLSPGHASVLLYSMLFLTGHGLELDDIKNFRKLGSKTPGHPERGHTAGVEVTTGPLGQGISNAVGMALAEANQRARFGDDLCSHYTFAIVSDGDLMEGISHEAGSLAGHLGLGRLVVVYDDNHITIDGATELALTDDAGKRFESYGWHVMEVGEIANDMAALEKAIRDAMAVTDKPSFIRLRSHIGYPSPNKTDTSAAHGSPLGPEEIALTKAAMGVSPEAFHVPEGLLDAYRANAKRAQAKASDWKNRASGSNEKAVAFSQLLSGHLPAGWDSGLPTYETGKMSATREASGECFNALTATVPALVGGGADLTGNTGTMIKNVGTFSSKTPDGRLIHFGVREHAMAAVMNGMAAHGGALPVGGTFFVFSDYMRGAVRVGAISQLKVIHSWTHDSLGVGEDGPTHQPIEHLASLRAMPGLRLIRPADGNEVAAAWRIAVEAADGPTGLVLGRQKVPTLPGTSTLAASGVARGAYVLVTGDKDEPDIVLVGSGSEVQHCVKAAEMLVAEGYSAQVVSMPSWDLFDDQDDDYMDSVFPPEIPVVACEAGTSFGWERFADLAVTVDTWGASAPAEQLMEEYGLTAESVFEAALLILESE